MQAIKVSLGKTDISFIAKVKLIQFRVVCQVLSLLVRCIILLQGKKQHTNAFVFVIFMFLIYEWQLSKDHAKHAFGQISEK